MTRATMSQVSAWHAAAAATAGAAVAAADSEFTAAMGQVARLVNSLLGDWQGAAGTAAELRAVEQQLCANHIGAALVDIADAFAAAGTLERVRGEVEALEREARAHGCRVRDDGVVTAARSGTGDLALDLIFQAGLDAEAKRMQARLIALLDCAGATDADAGARLTAAGVALAALEVEPAGGQLDSRVAAVLGGTALLPDEPSELCALWRSLTPADQDALFAFDPLLGARDGLPALARDHYNRLSLARLTTAARDRQRWLTDEHPDWSRAQQLPTTPHDWIRLHDWEAERQRARDLLTGYATVAAEVGPAAPNRLLLDLDGNGHAAIALGNPDAASNVATFVPGTGSALGEIDQGMNRARNLLGAANRADASARTAVIAWYGYDAPPTLSDALGDRRARQGAVLLDAFESGLRATHPGPPARATVIGHSYGGTLIGFAAREPGLAADAVIFVGAPGVDASDVSELRLVGIAPDRNTFHIFSTADLADPVPVLGRYLHGTNPVDREFLATVFTSSGGAVCLPVVCRMPFAVSAHGKYWEPGNPGLQVQGEIITGRYLR